MTLQNFFEMMRLILLHTMPMLLSCLCFSYIRVHAHVSYNGAAEERDLCALYRANPHGDRFCLSVSAGDITSSMSYGGYLLLSFGIFVAAELIMLRRR